LNHFILRSSGPVVAALVLLAFGTDAVATLGDRQAPWDVARWALLGALVPCSVLLVSDLFNSNVQGGVVERRRAWVAGALTSAMVALATWRWTQGREVIASADGGYPALMALAFLLAIYRSFLGSDR
jgi:hypothetical protein